jgi:prophage repressor
LTTVLGKNIRYYRKLLGYTQTQLADALGGGGKSLVSNYENGYSEPDVSTLVKLADIFDVSLDELVGRGRSPY